MLILSAFIKRILFRTAVFHSIQDIYVLKRIVRYNLEEMGAHSCSIFSEPTHYNEKRVREKVFMVSAGFQQVPKLTCHYGHLCQP